jgi:hypothetical protein
MGNFFERPQPSDVRLVEQTEGRKADIGNLLLDQLDLLRRCDGR